jgi:hypothetical protein
MANSDLERIAAEALNGTQPQSEERLMVIPQALGDVIVAYLARQPWAEVNGMIVGLKETGRIISSTDLKSETPEEAKPEE